jgi:hypothetical protein
MATYQLRPMSVGEILDGALHHLRSHFGTLFTIALLCLAVPSVIEVYLLNAFGQMAFLARPILFGSALLLEVIGFVLATGAVVRVVSDAHLGRSTTVGQALGFSARKLGAILVAGLSVSLILGITMAPVGWAFFNAGVRAMVMPGPEVLIYFGIGLVAAIIPVTVATGFAVVLQAVVLEKLPSPLSALGRSWSLTRGHRLRIFVLLAVVGVLLGLLEAGTAMIANALQTLGTTVGVAALAVLRLFRIIVFPLTSCVLTLVYYDLRVRKEAFDLEHLNQQINLAPSRA